MDIIKKDSSITSLLRVCLISHISTVAAGAVELEMSQEDMEDISSVRKGVGEEGAMMQSRRSIAVVVRNVENARRASSFGGDIGEHIVDI